MTQREFILKYGEVEVQFEGYYKFTFTFGGITKDGESLTVDIGGGSDDIYRLSIKANEYYKIKDLGVYILGYKLWLNDDESKDDGYELVEG